MKHRGASIGEWFRHRAVAFCTSDRGSHTIEAVIWTPVFILVFALIINLSLIYHDQSRMVRVAQDANRAYSVGALTSLGDIETYVAENLSDLAADLEVSTSVSGGTVTTGLSIPLATLISVNLPIDPFEGRTMSISVQHFVEN